MTAEDRKGPDMDELIREAFADDLPLDVAAGMRERVEIFLSGKAKGEGRVPAAAWGWFLHRSVWAALSILMLIAGILLQSMGSRNALAERISRIRTELANPAPGRRPDGFPEARAVTKEGRPVYLLDKKEESHDRDQRT
jgi:hypothetical protein